MYLGACLWSGLYLLLFTGNYHSSWTQKVINGWGVRTVGISGQGEQWYIIDEKYEQINCPIWVYNTLKENNKCGKIWWCLYAPGSWKTPKPYVYTIEKTVSPIEKSTEKE